MKDIPILFVISGDPVEAGLDEESVAARTATLLVARSFRSTSREASGLLKQAVPRLRSLAVLSNTEHPGEKSELHATETAAKALGINLVYVAFSQSPFGASPELDKALATVRRAQPDAMVVFPEGATMANRLHGQVRHRTATAVDVRLERICRRGRVDELRSESARSP